MIRILSPSVGQKVPPFFVKDHEGIELDSEDLLGSPYVIYFYPKDDTSVCAKEACAFRDILEELEELGTLVIGVSADNAESHGKFIKKHGLNFPLLCDENFELARKFDVLEEKVVDNEKKMSIIRSTFLVDSSGIVRWIEKPVSIDGHIERVMKAVQENLE